MNEYLIFDDWILHWTIVATHLLNIRPSISNMVLSYSQMFAQRCTFGPSCICTDQICTLTNTIHNSAIYCLRICFCLHIIYQAFNSMITMSHCARVRTYLWQSSDIWVVELLSSNMVKEEEWYALFTHLAGVDVVYHKNPNFGHTVA